MKIPDLGDEPVYQSCARKRILECAIYGRSAALDLSRTLFVQLFEFSLKIGARLALKPAGALSTH